jgi:5-methylcytosine-specific restriction endonuclease McrA
MSVRWPPKRQAMVAGRRVKDAPGRRSYEYRCANCGRWFPEKGIQMDHIVPCGSIRSFEDVAAFLERMLVEADGYQVLCRECNQNKGAKV